MDETTLELLSRHMDDDLDEEDRRRLEARLSADPRLSKELEGMRRVRGAVAEVARLEAPPAALDALVKPLRVAAPEKRQLRPVYGWLAAAATLVLSVTVALEVARRQPGAPESAFEPEAQPSAAAPRSSNNGYFKLQPLPTRAGPEDSELLGASEHLLASPVPEPEVEPPPPLEVIGPLATGEIPGAETPEQPTRDRPSTAQGELSERARGVIGVDRQESREPEGAQPSAADDFAPAPRPAAAPQAATRDRKSAASVLGRVAPASALVLRVAVGEEIVTVSLGRAADLVPGVYTVEVTMSAGTVTAARPAPDAEPTPAAEAVCAALRNLHVPGVPDGTHRADATIVPEG